MRLTTRQHFLTIFALLLCLVNFTAEATAEEEPQLCPICQTANKDSVSYVEKAASTLARGALNASLGWTELIRVPAKETKEGGNVFMGIANGFGAGISRTFVGFAEIFTFWTPKSEGEYLHLIYDCPLDTTK